MRIDPDTAPPSAQPPRNPGGPPGRQEQEAVRPAAPRPGWALAPDKDPLDYDDGAWM
jgi:hypothetical protein